MDSEKERLNAENWAPEDCDQQFSVVRRVYHQEDLNKDAHYHKPRKQLKETAKKAAQNCGVGACVLNAVPILKWLPRYSVKRHLIADVIAGITVAVMQIPQGMAYSMLSEVPPIVGLYTAFFPALVYVVFGTSPHVSMGAFSITCLMAGKVVNKYTYHPEMAHDLANSTVDHAVAADPLIVHYTNTQVLCIVTLTVGIIQVLMWTLRLGVLSTLLSDPLVSGFTTAASLQILASQLKDLFGVKLPKLPATYQVVYTVMEVCKNLPNLNWAAFIISCITCFIIAINNEVLKPWVSKRSKIPVPIELVAIVVGTLVAKYCHLKQNYGVSIVGTIPTGLPVPEVPPLELMDNIILDAMTITIVSYSVTVSMSLIFANKDKYEIDANQELLALGSSNVFGSFFRCTPTCASLSRSYIQYQAGGKTAITTLVSGVLILFVLLWIGPFFEDLPRAVLASIIVVSFKGMFLQCKDLLKFWKLSKLDAFVWLSTFLFVVLVNIDIGLAVGLAGSLGSLFLRAQQPYVCLLGRVHGTDFYLDIKRYSGAEEIPGVKIFHYCGGLNFATKNLFRSRLMRKVGCMKPTKDVVEDDRSDTYQWDPDVTQKVTCVVLDLSALSYVDGPGVKALIGAHDELLANDINVLLAGANGPVQEMIARHNKLESDKLQVETFPSVHDAVVYYEAHQATNNGKITFLTNS